MNDDVIIMVTGSRNLDDEELVVRVLNAFMPSRIIVGDCPTGADLHARSWCRARGIELEVHVADWNQYGKSAGPRRNAELVRSAVDQGTIVVIAFPRNGSGTIDCIERAKAAGLRVEEF